MALLKMNFFQKKIYQNHKEAKKEIVKTIYIYNEKRPHSSIDFLTPNQAHKLNGVINKRWKQYPRKNKLQSTAMI
jgi:putative transposase